MGIVIQAIGLTKDYDDLMAVDHIDFSVRRSEVFGFLGPNGAGKTTTIRMLVGLTTPSEGTALINGHDIRRKMVEIKRCVGVVPETSNLYNELTAWENLLFMARLYHVPKGKRNERVQELLKTFNLWDRRNTRFGKFSKGLKRRLTVAAALVHNPNIVFLDEPTAGLDVMSARSFRDLLKDLKETGVTLFLTTHYIAEADQLCDRIAIIVKGKIVIVDTPENLKAVVKSIPVVEVSFDSQLESLNVGELEDLGQIKLQGNRMQIQTKNVSETIKILTVFAEKHDLEIVYLNTVNPNLEDAFVKLTGVKSEVMMLEKDQGGKHG